MKKFIALLLVVFMAFTLAGCSDNSDAKDDGQKAIIIGGSGPLTGPAAAYGLAVKNSAQLAVDEINAMGGLQFKLVFEDDTHNAETAVNCFGKLVDAKQQVSLLTTTTAPGTSVAPLTRDEYKVFALTPSASGPSVTFENVNDESSYYGNVFQMCFNDPNQGLASAQYIFDHKVGENIGIIFNSADSYSIGIKDKFEAKATELGLKFVECGTFIEGDSDFSTQVKACVDNKCDVVFLPIYYDPISLIMTEAAKQGYSTKFFGVDGMDGILGIENFDTALAEGAYLLTPFDASATDEKTQNYVKKYTEAYGTETLLQFGADAYDCVFAIKEACEKAGVNADMSAEETCDKLVATFTDPSFKFDGLTGTCTWNKNGQVDKTPKAVIIKDGKYVAAE